MNNWDMRNLQWDLIQSFAAVARLGSLSKAAVELAISQPTLSRQMAALEKQLEMTLFDRSTQGLKVTSAGAKLLESGELMQQAAEQFSRTASGAASKIEGEVRISANEVIGLYYLPGILADFGTQYPEVTIELDISNKAISLNKRDADIALRMFRPTQPELVVRRLPDIGLSFVASKKYLSSHASITDMNDFSEHRLIGFDRDAQMVAGLKQLGLPISMNDLNSRTDFLPLQIELARQNAGITITHRFLLNRFKELQAILPDIELPSLEFWLVCHADVQHNRRIKVVMDYLVERLSNLDLS